MKQVPVTIWYGCYDRQWSGVLIPDAFKHPAKMARGLAERLIRYGIEKGYWKPQDTLGDPFGGIGTTALVGADHGINVVAVELESQFVEIGNRNLAAHGHKWRTMGKPVPELLQGDSRRFADVVREAAGIVTSPPYDTMVTGAGGLNTKPPKKPGQDSGRSPTSASQSFADDRYGDDPAQIAKLKRQPLDAVLTPVVTSPAHIANLSAVVTSPPYERNLAKGHVGADKFADPARFAEGMAASGKGHSASAEARQRQFERERGKVYGETEGQIGRAAGETYWDAMSKVYSSCFEAIKPGGYLACVVKDYVRDWKRVPLCDDTMRLLEHVGFDPVERIHAMVTETTEHADLFEGTVTKKKERKSFFRRLQESKGAPPIDYEEVLIVRKPI